MDFTLDLDTHSTIIIAAVVLLYFLGISFFGSFFSKYSKDINDFFYSGQRFTWWLAAASMVATGIGSYSYLKYSEQGYNTGMSSAMGYTNDWFALPFFMFGWLPIIYLARVKSIPEYFERRFNKVARYVAVTIILCYMFYYIGYNLYTIGIAIEGMFGVPQLISIPLVAIVLGAYVTMGGQTAVIFTDFVQGFMLYLAGGIAIFAGIYALGGFEEWWSWLPISHRLPFVHLTENAKFNTSGLFWGEALAGSIAFAFMNQGFIMRYLTIKSVDECRKAAVFNLAFTLPVSAIIVGAVGWIAKSLVMKQAALGGLEGYNIIDIQNTFHTFLIVCWETLHQNSLIFGFVVAALTAALMSTVDTLINACAAVGIYDIYKPLIKPTASDKHYLKAARWASVISTVLGVLLVIWFNKQQGSLMSIHYKGIMVIIPSIVTTIFLGAFWKRFTPAAAVVSMVIGSILTIMTLWYPEWIEPMSRYVFGPINGKYIYMRSLFGMSITALIGIFVSFVTKPKLDSEIIGLTIHSMDEAFDLYKGGKANHAVGKKVHKLKIQIDNSIPEGELVVSAHNAKVMKAHPGDIIYIADSRWWLGGLLSNKVRLNARFLDDNATVALSSHTLKDSYIEEKHTATIEKII